MIQLFFRIMDKINKRQLTILGFIRNKGNASNQGIKRYLEDKFDNVSRITIVRDLSNLLEKKLIKKHSSGRNVYYTELLENKLLKYYNTEEYFKLGPDERSTMFNSFNFEIFQDVSRNIFTKDELENLKSLNDKYVKRVKKLSATILRKEFERLTIELSWKSSHMEGNTYSLIDTEILLKENKEAVGHKKEEAIMLLNHKKALDYILSNKSRFKKIGLRQVENIHKLIVEDLGVAFGLRKRIVGITGTRYKPLDNQYQIREVLEKSTRTINSLKDIFSKALLIILMISYIQPFEDGNKRIARLLGSAVLLANDACPLSFRSVDESDYKRAVILFYEQNSIRFFKELFIQQFEFAVGNYFLF